MTINKRLQQYTEIPPNRQDPVNYSPRADYLAAYIPPLASDIGQMADEFNATASEVNSLEQSSRASKEAAELAAQIANSSANIKGEFKVGETNALQGETWLYEGAFWYASVNTSATPTESSADWVSLSKHNSATGRNEQGAHPASAISRGPSNVDNDIGQLESSVGQLESGVEALNNKLSNTALSSTSPPSLPTLGAKNKAIFIPDESFDDLCLIVSRLSNGKRGWIAQAISDECAPSDASNYGGSSNYRPTYCLSGVFLAAKTTPVEKDPEVVVASLSLSNRLSMWGNLTGVPSLTTDLQGQDCTFSNLNVYEVPQGKSVTYLVSGRSTLRVGTTNASTESFKVEVGRGGNFYEYGTYSAKSPSTVGYKDVDIDVAHNGVTSVRVTHTGGLGEPFYVVGLNVGEPKEHGVIDCDCAGFAQTGRYLAGNGANEFASRETTGAGGRFFGTYHGGHGNFLERLRTSNASYNVRTQTLPKLLFDGYILLHSYSTLTTIASVYTYTASTQFGDGVTITHYSIDLVSGSATLCERTFTHMSTTAPEFTWVHLPKYVANKTTSGPEFFGQCQFIQQYRADSAQTINCYFSSVNVDKSVGAWVSFQPGKYNKQYYGEVISSDRPFVGGNFVTAKEFF